MALNTGRKNTAYRLITVGTILAALAVGCSKSTNPTTVKVHGKVTYKGQAVGEGTVTFQPMKPAPGSPTRPAVGTLEPDGTYELSTFAGGDGAVPGEYAVTVRSVGDVSVENPRAATVSRIPPKYANPAQGSLKATVPADSSARLELNFTLED